MKKTTILLASFCSFALIASLAPTTVDAAPTTVSTTAEATFKEKEGPVEGEEALKMIKPGTKNTVIYRDSEAGNFSSGTLRFSFIPNFNFGEIEIDSLGSDTYATYATYFEKLPTATPAPSTHVIPHFLQVIDETGEPKGFDVTAQGTVFKTADGEEMPNTRVQFLGQTLSNNGDANPASPSSVLTGMAQNGLLTDGVIEEIGVANATPIMKTVEGAYKNGTISSLVFKNGYQHGDYGSAGTVVEGTNSGVRLHVPSGEQQVKKKYTSTITWTLTRGE